MVVPPFLFERGSTWVSRYSAVKVLEFHCDYLSKLDKVQSESRVIV
jgi:hypothetical protein